MAHDRIAFEYMAVDALAPWPANAHVHPPEQISLLRRSIREFGFIIPILINDKNEILAGHGRIQAAKQEFIKEVPVVRASHLTQAQQRAYVLADNRLMEHAAWDFEIVHQELEGLKLDGFDLSITGFNLADVEIDDETAHGLGLDRPADDDLDEDADVVLTVPKALATEVKRWLAAGNRITAVGMGKGVVQRLKAEGAIKEETRGNG
jgi:ParB-like chromosome segregation protein Spo0J